MKVHKSDGVSTSLETIAAVVLTYNERQHIQECLSCLTWADAVVVVDSGSDDGTRQLAMDVGATVFEHQFANFAAQRNFALQNVKANWVLFVDADERVSEALATEIRQLLQNARYSGYWLPRRNRIFGNWLRATGWNPDLQLRLLQRNDAHYVADRPVHETVELRGAAGIMETELIHEGPVTIREFRSKQQLYVPLGIEGLRLQGVKARIHSPILQACREFWRRLVVLKGYRDGWRGAVLSILMAEYEYRLYWGLRAMSDSSAN